MTAVCNGKQYLMKSAALDHSLSSSMDWALSTVGYGYSHDDANTNIAKSFLSRLRRAEVGIHHRVAGPNLSACASAIALRDNNRPISNGEHLDDD